MIWEGGRDRDQGEPGVIEDLACLAFCMVNTVLWPLLLYVLLVKA